MNSNDYGALEVSIIDRVTTVVLNRPEARNAINSVLHDNLTRVFTALDQDPDTDVAILTGAGGAFCAGGDIPWLRQLAGDVSEVERVLRADRRITEHLTRGKGCGPLVERVLRADRRITEHLTRGKGCGPLVERVLRADRRITETALTPEKLFLAKEPPKFTGR